MRDKIIASIVVPSYNAKKYVSGFLDSVRKLNFPKKRMETIIVDNDSEDGSAEFIKKNYPEVVLIKRNKNLGFAEGCNVGVRKSRGRYISIQNIDVVLDRNWLKELVKVMEQDKSLGLAGQRMIDRDKKGRYEFKGYYAPTLMQFHVLVKDIGKNTKEPFELFGSAAPFYRRSIVDVPFDPDYFMYAEDTYFAWLAMLMGYKTKIVPKAFFYHEGSTTVKSMKKDFFFTFLGERNRLINLLLFFELKTIIKLLPVTLFTLLVYNLFDLKNLLPRLKSYLWLIINFNKVLKKRKKIQAKRKIDDSKITRHMSSKMFDEFLTGNRLVRKLIAAANGISSIYCRFLNIRTRECYGGI